MSASIAEINPHNNAERVPANFFEWKADVVEAMAADDALLLTEDHWMVIEFLRNYYETHKIAPAMRLLTREMGRKLGIHKANTRYLYQLFPQGPARQACRYAGIPT